MEREADVWAVVPAKPFAEAKTRLAPALAAAQRGDLARNLLKGALTAVAAGGPFGRILVVSRDKEALELAASLGAQSLAENGSGLNPALTQAAATAIEGGAAALLVVAADLPLLSASDVRAMLQASSGSAPVIAPDRRRSGTNSLLLRPPGLLKFAFGPDSFLKHSAAARALGFEPCVVDLPGLAFDLDSPRDLDELPAMRSRLGLDPLTGDLMPSTSP